ncbi:hypothetical protein AKJ40_02720 [candidate division MSBL1 archaeon SCGC-AAA259M10]|uniref:PIN domain-containing protein n=1 Tax=candidate division MSBL1 archaeon SCGC-AAA259M10 TaxID=1698270 RepID=A0A133UZN1_9EURY|nr:hypothetical protein AKJ40_02720 [candidate division MSBL1 archaeon SCGC-AAA259M10]
MKKGNESVAQADELQILLNLYDDELTLSYPIFPHFDVLRANVHEDGYDLELISGMDDYKDKADSFGEYSDEMPSFYDLRDCLLSSGVIKHENLEELEKYVNRRVESGVKRVFFCPDTNILYQNFLSSFGKIKLRNVAIPDTVKDELKNKLNSKYGRTELQLMKQHAKCQGNLLDELNNRRKKASRKASYLAMQEYERFSGKTITAQRESTYDSGENDRIIVESLRSYEKNNPVRVTLLTADDSLRDLCRAEDLDHFYLKVPHNFEADSCSHGEFLTLIRNLSLVFGFVKLNSSIIFGEFGGKNRADALKLRFLDKKVYKEFKKHQKICRELNKLGIRK